MEIIFWLICVGAVYHFAQKKGKNAVLWGISAFIFSPLLVGIVLALSKDEKQEVDIEKNKAEQQQLKDRLIVTETNINTRINKVEEKIDGLSLLNKVEEKRLGSIKELTSDEKNCPHCGEVIKKDAIKCRYCGEDVSEHIMVECPYCKELIRKDAIKCKYCRSVIGEENV